MTLLIDLQQKDADWLVTMGKELFQVVKFNPLSNFSFLVNFPSMLFLKEPKQFKNSPAENDIFLIIVNGLVYACFHFLIRMHKYL